MKITLTFDTEQKGNNICLSCEHFCHEPAFDEFWCRLMENTNLINIDVELIRDCSSHESIRD